MKCKKCGATLLETDSFCLKCGEPVQDQTCPHCGAELRDGTKFCHNCGEKVSEEPEDDEIPVTPQKTIDIPFELIEKSIMMEAEQAIEKRQVTEQREEVHEPAAPKRKNKADAEPVPDFSEMFREEEEDWEDYEEEEKPDRLSKITKLLGILILLIVVFLGIFLIMAKGADRKTDAGKETSSDIVSIEQEEETPSESKFEGKIEILTDVNIRDHADKNNSTVITTAKTGEVYDYYELVKDAWYHIEMKDGRDGYIYKEYVKVIE